MEGIIYLICAATALGCSALLLRSYRQTGTRLLLWCGLCFLALTVDNLALFADRILFPHIDFHGVELFAGVLGVLVLLYGLVWDSR
jgi:hypothetical protein